MKKITFVCAALFAAACGGSGNAPSTTESNALSGQPASAGAAKSGGQVQTLLCTPGGNFETFTAKLDYSGYDVGSGFFDVTSARINDGYATAELKCTGHTLPEIDCVGFWFDIGSEIVEVTTKKGDNLTASYVPLKGDLVKMHTPPWACTVK